MAAVYCRLYRLMSLGCCLVGLNLPAFAALAVLVPPTGRSVAGSVFGPGLHWQRPGYSWPQARHRGCGLQVLAEDAGQVRG